MNFQLEEGGGCAAAGLAAFSSSFNTMYPPLQFVLAEWRCEAAGRDVSSYPALSTVPSMSTETVLCSQPGKAGAVKYTLARDTREQGKAKEKGSIHCVAVLMIDESQR